MKQFGCIHVPLFIAVKMSNGFFKNIHHNIYVKSMSQISIQIMCTHHLPACVIQKVSYIALLKLHKIFFLLYGFV